MRPDRLFLSDIVEAVSRLPEGIRRHHAHVPWSKVIAFRNLVVHEYFGLNWEIIWNTATELVPELRRQVVSILGTEFP